MNISTLALGIIGLSTAAFGQTSVTIKPSPASNALVAAAKDLDVEQKSFDTLLLQARSTAETTQKQLSTQLEDARKKLDTELHADKKYKDEATTIDTLIKQLQDNINQAQQNFYNSTNPIQAKIASDKALIDGLVPIVREESSLPPSATFDSATQKWNDSTKAPEKPLEPKK